MDKSSVDSRKPDWDQGRRTLRAAALSFVEQGWPVVPGPLCDGLRYIGPGAARGARATAPVVAAEDGSLDTRVVAHWWAERPYTVLAPVGVAFDVLCAPTLLATVATGLPEFRDNLCPVAMSPQGARFLVRPGGVLDPDLVGVRGVEIQRRGAFLPLPPSRVVGGSMSWWVTPAAACGIGEVEAVQNALLAAAVTLPETRKAIAVA
jgi:hypothetical protein